MSKGLGAPVGSLVLGSKSFILQARRVRKVFGGGMRQAGFMAAAGIYALDNHVERLREDHARAYELGKALAARSFIKDIEPVDTNIVIFYTTSVLSAKQLVEKLYEKGILCVAISANSIRFVTHLDFDDLMLEKTIEIIKAV